MYEVEVAVLWDFCAREKVSGISECVEDLEVNQGIGKLTRRAACSSIFSTSGVKFERESR